MRRCQGSAPDPARYPASRASCGPGSFHEDAPARARSKGTFPTFSAESIVLPVRPPIGGAWIRWSSPSPPPQHPPCQGQARTSRDLGLAPGLARAPGQVVVQTLRAAIVYGHTFLRICRGFCNGCGRRRQALLHLGEPAGRERCDDVGRGPFGGFNPSAPVVLRPP